MDTFTMAKAGHVAPIILEDNGIYGLAKMTNIFAEDIQRVTREKAKILNNFPNEEFVVYVGVAESKSVKEKFADLIDADKLTGKRESYGIFMFGNPQNNKQKILAIIGSDKRGAIYGMFNISEYIGVSPWYYFADATVKQRDEIVIKNDITGISKEPSVRYRGFFINDEQPCLGNWAKENFGSISPGPVLYEKIFELLLRLKGNYIWPAMWRSDFTLDYIENAQLANEMGVIVGSSHHEPCCRSGQEFQRLKNNNPLYGNEWSFLSNSKGITEFWKDGLVRNKNFENLITIGMRGENDSYLMPENATLEDNINVLKSAIATQKQLISKYAPSEHPQLLALYKEVEEYYYGDENTKGLKDWDVLDNDIMMLCDDNFANVRTLPDDELRKKKGGFGMYYHFDYFGDPVSYLWIDSSPLSKVWEQMTMAYDYGVRSAWIVNVGDIKNQELPLSYFLDLAYDFEKWGTSEINKTSEYTIEWLKKLGFENEIALKGAKLIEEYVKLNAKRRPEAVHSDTYHPCHENEAEELLYRICENQRKSIELYELVKGSDLEECFFQLIYYPLNAVAEINKMHLYAALNQLYIRKRMKKANEYGKMIDVCIKEEQRLTEEYHSRNNGKWNHMQSVYHIGYTNWNDEQCEYPISQFYNPVRDSRLLVSVKKQEDWTCAHRWTRHVLHMPLCFETNSVDNFVVANGGDRQLHYRIDWDAEWVEIRYAKDRNLINKNTELITDVLEEFIVSIDKNKWDANQSAIIRIYGINCETVADESENAGSITMVELQLDVSTIDVTGIKDRCFVESEGCISIEAVHFMDTKRTSFGEYRCIEDYGRTVGGVKAFPTTVRFDEIGNAPQLMYRIFAVNEGDYSCNLYVSASNPVVYQGKMELTISANDGEIVTVNTIPESDYVPWKSNSWRKGVLDQIHLAKCTLKLKKGINEVRIFAVDPAVVLEKIVLWNPNIPSRDSYLGPKESIVLNSVN